MSISENIKRLREIYDLTQADLAEVAGVTKNAVSQWENGRAEPRMGAIERIAACYGIPKGFIVDDGGMDQVDPITKKPRQKPLPLPNAHRIVTGGDAHVPLVPMVLAGTVHAGEPTDEPDADTEIMVPQDIAEEHPAGFALHVEGDCMDRVIPDGYDVVVDPEMEPRPRSIVVCRLEDTNEVVMRRLVGSRQTMVLEADSHSPHDDLVFPATSSAVNLVGVVVWAQCKLW